MTSPQRHDVSLDENSLGSQLKGIEANQLGTNQLSSNQLTPQKTVQYLKQQLKDFRVRTSQRSLPALLADQFMLDGSATQAANNTDSSSGNSQWLDNQTDPWGDVTQIVDDWEDQNAIALDEPSSQTPPPQNDEEQSWPQDHSEAESADEMPCDEMPCDEMQCDEIPCDDSWLEQSLTEPAPPAMIYSTTCPALDQWFPDQGIPAGSIVEIVSSEIGAAATHFSLSLAKTICGDQGLLVIIDRRHDFHAAALVSLGFDLQNVLLVRPDNDQDHLWALEQALGHTSVAAVWTRIDMLDDRYQRRWQLAAEKSQAVGLLQRPESVLTTPTWAFAQMKISPNPYSSLLTANHSYYQNHSRFKSLVADNFPFQENWIVDLQAIKIRGQFEQPTLRLELHNYLNSDTTSSASSFPFFTQRLPHPNDPAVTKTFERFDRNLHEVDRDESRLPTSQPEHNQHVQSSEKDRRAVDHRVRLASRLADSTPDRRTNRA